MREWGWALLLTLSACGTGDKMGATNETAASIRVASYNTSLYSEQAGGLIARLENGDEDARKIAAVIQNVRPDIVLLNEFDFDEAGRAAKLFQDEYLAVGQHGQSAIHFAHSFIAPVNTGVQSGFDLNRDGAIGGDGRQRGEDAFGYGLHPGQYGMLVLSRFPIDGKQARTFQKLLWKDLPGAHAPRLPDNGQAWYAPEAWAKMRLSSKSHWDLPIHTPRGVLHLLASHPTPPTFDGPENRNGLRNADELRLWQEYLSDTDAKSSWLCDDQGRCGGLAADARFVIVGDLNADPQDGDGIRDGIHGLLSHPRVNADVLPQSSGAPQRATAYGLKRAGDPHGHTGDFGKRVGTLRIDYAQPSRNLGIIGSGVFWPTEESAEARFASASDHHLVWVDIDSDWK